MLDMRHVLIVKLLHPSIWQRTSVFVFVCAGIVRWGIVLLLAHGRVAKCQTWWPVLKNAPTLLSKMGKVMGVGLSRGPILASAGPEPYVRRRKPKMQLPSIPTGATTHLSLSNEKKSGHLHRNNRYYASNRVLNAPP